MTLLILGLIGFFAIHSLPMFSAKRTTLIQGVGELPYKGIFAVLSLAAFVAIVMGKAQAPFVAIWNPPVQLAIVTKILMLPAFVLLVAVYIPSNIKNKVKHPMLAGVKLWALGHLMINGDLASLLLFGSFLVYAIVDIISVKKRQPAKALPAKKPIYMDVLVILIGVAAYGGVAMHHQQLFGVPLF